jgi:hypothetical protein
MTEPCASGGTYHGRKVLAALFIAGFMVYSGGLYCFALLVPPLTEEFHWSRAATGGLVTAFWLSAPRRVSAYRPSQAFPGTSHVRVSVAAAFQRKRHVSASVMIHVSAETSIGFSQGRDYLRPENSAPLTGPFQTTNTGYSRPTNTALACASRSSTLCFSAALFHSG